ncbi:MAG TPA: sulfurtransferase [Steroidobacteraceae bacterium]|nr:sulfurtransferase [Steroidobacteraceae bacterium]
MSFTTLIDAAGLRDLVDKPDTAILDCRFDLMNPEGGRRAYLAGHIPGARYADLNQDLSAPITASSGRHPLPAAADFAATLDRLGVGPGTQVVAYDDSSGALAAARAWWLLRWAGHPAAAVLDGGIKAWIGLGCALESGDAQPLQAARTGRGRGSAPADSAAVIDAAELEARLADPSFLLIDARAPERYAGTAEPIDAVAGHVKGAVNHPFSTNLAADGRFLPAPELRELWAKRLAGRNPAQVASMCGSGVTACHNLLSLEIAGFSGAKLYAGSWSEWIRDPRRPIARGG